MLAICSQYGVTYYDSEEEVEKTVRKRFAVLRLGDRTVADETYDVPLGAIPFFFGSAEERASTYKWELTLIDTTPTPSARYSAPKNHIDPYPVYPKQELRRRPRQVVAEALPPEEAPEVDEGEATDLLMDDEIDIFATVGKTRELTGAAEHILIEGSDTNAEWLTNEQLAELEQKALSKEPKRRRISNADSWAGRGYNLECALATAGREKGPARQGS